MKTILFVCLALLPAWGMAQGCTPAQYQKMLKEADQAVKRGEYDLAINKLQSAKVCQPGNVREVDDKILEVFREVNNQRRLAEKNARELSEQTIRTKSALLASRSREINRFDRNAALWVAFEAYKTKPISDATKALHDIVSQPGSAFYINDIVERDKCINSISISPNGKYILTGSISPPGGELYLRERDGYSTIWTIDGKFVQIFPGEPGGVSDVDFSPDGKFILTTNNFFYAVLRALDGTRVDTLFICDHLTNQAFFSPDGKYILCSGNDSIKIFKTDGAIMDKCYKAQNVATAIFTPDSKNILTGNWNGKVQLWTLNGDVIQTFSGHNKSVNSLDVSPDGEFFVTGSSDKTSVIWNMSGEKIAVLEGHEDRVYSVAVAPDGNTIITGSSDNTVKIWSHSGKLLQTLYGHTSAVTSVAFTPDAQYIVTGSLDGSVKIWNANINIIKKFETRNDTIKDIVCSPDGTKYLTGSKHGIITIWSNNAEPVKFFDGNIGEVTKVAMSPNGLLFAAGGVYGSIKVWRMDGVLLDSFSNCCIDSSWNPYMEISSLSFSPDSKGLLFSDNKIAAMRKLSDGSMIKFENIISDPLVLTFSPDGEYILGGGKFQTPLLWTVGGKPVREFKGHSNVVSDIIGEYDIFSISFSPDGNSIVTGSFDGTAKLWSINGTLLHTFEGGNGFVLSVAFSPDGKYILTSATDGSVNLWTIDGKQIQTISEPNKSGVIKAMFSPDGNQILTLSSNSATLCRPIWSILKEISPLNTSQKMTYFNVND